MSNTTNCNHNHEKLPFYKNGWFFNYCSQCGHIFNPDKKDVKANVKEYSNEPRR